MKRNLIPVFIQNKIKENVLLGNNSAFILSGDICNFTPIVENLMKKEKTGAEQIGILLNKTLGEITNVIYNNKGFITSFSGDAFTAIFLNSDINEVTQIMKKIIDIFSLLKLSFVKNNIQIRLGLSYGNIDWYIMGNKIKTYIFRGKGLNNAYNVQQCAIPNTICFDASIKKLINKKNIKRYKNLFYINGILCKDLSQNYKINNKMYKLNTLFFPKILNELETNGEFRRVIPIFINIPYDIETNILENIIIEIEKLIIKYNGYFNKFEFGDKGGMGLIIFGAPFTFENMVESAIHFTIDIKNKFPDINLTIGIDYGITYSGFIGSKIWQEYTVIGDIVNTAARLASLNNNEINISEKLINETKLFSFKKIKSIKLKGKQETISIYKIEKKIEKKIEYNSPFVGRNNEIKDVLKFIKKNNKQNLPSYIYVKGESGIGKTRFVYEIINKLNYPNYYTSADPIIQESLLPIKQLFSQLLNFNIHSNSKTKLKNIDAFLKKHFYDDYITYFPLLLSFFSIEEKSSINLSAQEKLQTTFYILKQILQLITKNNSIIIILDDTMWMDNDTIDFINYLNNEKINNIILFFVFREDNNITNRIKIKKSHEITLSHFSINGIKEFAKRFFNCDISDSLIKILWNKSEGNPLFLEQISLHLLDNNLLKKDKGLLYLKNSNYDLPSSIDRLIVSRLDNLSGETRNGIQKASVLGKEFEILLLEYLLGNKKIKKILNEGEKNKIITLITNQTGTFRHTLLYEIAYKMQFENTLKKLHKKIAFLYEKIYIENLTPYYETLYYHYSKTSLKSKTIFYLKKSIEKEIQTYSNEMALMLLKELLNYETSRKNKYFAYIKMGEIYSNISEYKNALNAYKKSFQFADKKIEKAHALKGYGKTLWFMGKYKNALNYYSKSYDIYNKINDKRGVSEIYQEIALVYYNLGKFNKAINNYNNALKFAGNNIKLKTSINSNLGLLLYKQGEMKKAMKYYKKALQIAIKDKNLSDQAILHLRMGLIDWKNNKYEKALNHFFTSLNINRKIGNKRGEGIVLGNIGIIYMEINKEKEGLEYYFKALEIDRQIDNLENETIILGNVANYYASKKQYEKSLQYYKDAIKIDKILGNKWSEAIDYGNMAEVYKLLKKYNEADKYFKKCIYIVKGMNARHPTSHFLLKRAQLQYVMKNYNTALKLVNDSEKIAREINIENIIENCSILKLKTIKKIKKGKK